MTTIFVKLYLKTISHRPDVYILNAKSHASGPSTLRHKQNVVNLYILLMYFSIYIYFFLRTGNGWQFNIFGKISFVQNIKNICLTLYTHTCLSSVLPPGADATSYTALRTKTAVSQYCWKNYTES